MSPLGVPAPPQGTVSHVVGAALVIAIVDNEYKGPYDIDNAIISLDYSDSVMWRHRVLQKNYRAVCTVIENGEQND